MSNCRFTCSLCLFTILLLGNIISLSADIFDEYWCEEEDDFVQIEYLKIGGCFANVGQHGAFMPVVSYGRRYEALDYGVDYSINAGYAKGFADNNRSVVYYTLPKVLCLYFTAPFSSCSPYIGAGASWMGLINNRCDKQIFHGVAAEASIGFEIQRTCQMRTFVQADVTQPVIPAYRKGKFPTPTFIVTFGLGF